MNSRTVHTDLFPACGSPDWRCEGFWDGQKRRHFSSQTSRGVAENKYWNMHNANVQAIEIWLQADTWNCIAALFDCIGAVDDHVAEVEDSRVYLIGGDDDYGEHLIVYLIWWWWWWLLLYSAILRSRADSLRSHVILHEWLAFYSAFLNIHRSGVLTALA